MRVLLTGATGLIGRETARALAGAGHDVVALSRAGGAVEGAGETCAADLLDSGDMRLAVVESRCDGLVHLAWYGGKGRMGAPENLDWAGATLRLVRAFAAAGGRHVVASGSCAEYDWSGDAPFAEDSPLVPQGLYGIAKARTGQAVVEAAPALGLTLAWARIFFVYGPGEPPGRLLGDLIAGLRAGRDVPCTDGTQARDFLATPDIAQALVQLLDARAGGPVNVASGTTATVGDIVAHVARRLGRPDLVRLGALPRPDGDPDRIAAVTDRLRGLGFRPRLSLAEGLDDALARTP